MSIINIRSTELANLIAAGEVIERPASVIKELVENSIDAKAKNIYVGVTRAGKGTIRVKDDGTGRDRKDSKLCFVRHASSKIKTEYDLSRIHTLGFRGEAIPSISAVSHVVLTTSTGEGVGTRIESSPNQDLVVLDAPSRKGTIFEISDLFFNTPARLKYLKSDQVENANIIERVEHRALGFPGISFSLAIDGKEVFRTSGRGDLLEAIQKIFGNTIAQSLYPINYEGMAYSFHGFISKPEVNSSRRKNELTFLNHRCIYDYKFNKAIEQAYKDYLPPDRYPFIVLDFDIDSSLVDVNVHPTKKEVRISMEDDRARDLVREIKTVLLDKRPIYSASEDKKTSSAFVKEEKKEEKVFSYAKVAPKKEEEHYFQDSLPLPKTFESHAPYIVKKEVKEEPVSETITTENIQKSKEVVLQDIAEEKETYNPIKEEQIQEPIQESVQGLDDYAHPRDESESSFPERHPIGQVLQTYILCDSKDCFYILDQHAAAERVNYEKTEARFASIRSRVVPLFPLIIELSPKEIRNYDREHVNRLKSIGIITEEYLGKAVKVTEMPSFLHADRAESVISDCVHSCLNDEACDPLSLLHLTIATIACKKSIKANHIRSRSEREALIKDLSQCKNPANCPHGRPTRIKVTKDDIEKIFRRSGF